MSLPVLIDRGLDIARYTVLKVELRVLRKDSVVKERRGSTRSHPEHGS